MITIPEFYAYGITWSNVVCDISKVEREDDVAVLFLDFYINLYYWRFCSHVFRHFNGSRYPAGIPV